MMKFSRTGPIISNLTLFIHLNVVESFKHPSKEANNYKSLVINLITLIIVSCDTALYMDPLAML